MTLPLKNMANALRFLSIDAVNAANSGHPGMPMGMADVITVLFTKFLRFNPKTPKSPDRDRFVLSNGHGSMLLYSLLYLTGYSDVSIDDLKDFRRLGAKTQGHPEYGALLGIETTGGPLGQGLATAVGIAYGEKLQGRYNKTYVSVGDGCLMEGISHEAIDLAGALCLSNLVVLWDNNNITIDGSVDMVSKTDQKARFKAAGWSVFSCDGHDFSSIENALRAAQNCTAPVFIDCKTIIGYGSPNLAGTSESHGAPLGAEETEKTRASLDWPHKPFDVPKDLLKAWRSLSFADLSGHEDACCTAVDLSDFKRKCLAERPGVATRKASQMVLGELSKQIPTLVGGSADLTDSNLTKTPASKNYTHYGVREHGMAACMNGLALSGMIPYGGAYLAFSDYAKPAIRMSSIMKLQVLYVFTHDSIGVGEDGTTHQPIEQLASFRAMPGIQVFRPCDPIETAECYELALQFRGPSLFAFSRQAVPFIREEAKENLSAKGAYLLKDGKKDLTLIATGSEVSLALEAGKKLGARVVSMPSMTLFDKQPAAYKKELLKGKVVSIEAASTFGWAKYADFSIGIDTFGESGKSADLFKHFGFTTDAICDKIKEQKLI